MFWSKYFGEDPIKSSANENAYEAAKARWQRPLKRPQLCYDKYPNCLITNDRIFTNHAKALIFHWRDFDYKDLPMVRNTQQQKVLYNLESPVNTPPLSSETDSSFYFDLLATYRRDSDVFVPYGQFFRANSSRIIKKQFSAESWKSKIIPIAWMVSNCNTQSLREDYVNELSNHIQVDIFGKCGRLECSIEKMNECYKDMARKYFFYLSFENSLCR